MHIAIRMKRVRPSATLEIVNKVKAMERQGIPVIRFDVGEPDFQTPENIRLAAKKAIDENFSYYTPVLGINQLKEAIVAKFQRDNGLHYSVDEIAVCNGAKHALYNIFHVAFNEDDEVLVFSPYWVSFVQQLNILGIKSRIVPLSMEQGYQLTPQIVKPNIIPGKTRGMIINSPGNPTGAVFSRENLDAIAELAIRHDLLVISDETYEKIIYGNKQHYSIAQHSEEMKKRTVVVNALSKTYSMTGWRVGYLAASSEFIKSINKIQGHVTSNVCSIAQKAAVEALNGPQDFLTDRVAQFYERQQYLLQRLDELPGISTPRADGSFYLFPSISKLLGRSHQGRKINDASDLADMLLDSKKVSITPGNAFGTAQNIRISYATSLENLEEGMNRISSFISELD